MEDERPTEYPREATPVRERPASYPKDGKLAVYIGIASIIGLLQNGFRALGFGVGLGTVGQMGAIVFTVLIVVRLVGGLGLMLSRAWAFALVLLSSLAILGLTAPGVLHHGTALSFLWLLFSLYLVIYCVVRLVGLDGPRPR